MDLCRVHNRTPDHFHQEIDDSQYQHHLYANWIREVTESSLDDIQLGTPLPTLSHNQLFSCKGVFYDVRDGQYMIATCSNKLKYDAINGKLPHLVEFCLEEEQFQFIIARNPLENVSPYCL